MTSPVYLSQRVLSDIQALPSSDRLAVVTALAANILLGVDGTKGLSPMETIVYTMLQNTIRRDSARILGA